MLSTAAIYRDRMGITVKESVLAILASASLTVTIFKAVFLAVFWNNFWFKKQTRDEYTQQAGTFLIKNIPDLSRSSSSISLWYFFAQGILFRYGVKYWYIYMVSPRRDYYSPTLSALFQVVYE